MSLTTRITYLNKLEVTSVSDFLDAFPSQKCVIPDLTMAMCLTRDVRNVLMYMHDVDANELTDEQLEDALWAAVRPLDTHEAIERLRDAEIVRYPTASDLVTELGIFAARFAEAYNEVIRFNAIPPEVVDPRDDDAKTDPGQMEAYEASVAARIKAKKRRKALSKTAVEIFMQRLQKAGVRIKAIREQLNDDFREGELEKDLPQVLKRLKTVAKEYHLFQRKAERVGMCDRHDLMRQAEAQTNQKLKEAKEKAAKELERKVKEAQAQGRRQANQTSNINQTSSTITKPGTQTQAPGPVVQMQTQSAKPAWSRAPDGRLQRPGGGDTSGKPVPVPKPAGTPAASGTNGNQGKPKGPGAPLHHVSGSGTPLMKVNIQINGVGAEAIVDPGATRTCVSQGLMTRVMTRAKVLVGPSEVRLTVPGDTDASTGQEAELSLMVKDLSPYNPTVMWTCPVMKGSREKVLLGADLLRHLGLMTDTGITIKIPEPVDEGDADGLPEFESIDELHHVAVEDPHHGVNINPDFPLRKVVEELVEEYGDVFGPLDAQGADLPSVVIDLKPGAEDKLPHARPRPVHPEVLPELQAHFDGLKEQGVVQDAHGPVASAVVIIRKKADKQGNRELRPCGDYRDLNELMSWCQAFCSSCKFTCLL